MKKFFYLLLVLVVCMVACTSEEIIPTERVRSHGISRANITSRVTLDNVKALVGVMRKATRAAIDEKDDDFICIVDVDNDTLFYVVNHPEGGWTMYASDKRVPAIVAENEKGKFLLSEEEMIAGEWLECMKEDMKAVRNAEDSKINFSTEEIEAHKNYWRAVCEPNAFVAKHLEKTRGTNFINNPQFIGHYELDTAFTSLVVYDQIDHLTQTRWHQHYPYNAYCPSISGGTSPEDRNPAGCVAIAGAQMLYFLHYKLDRPLYVPDSAYCIGYANGPVQAYQWEQYTHCWDVWAKMPHHGNPGYSVYDFDGNYVAEGRIAAPLVARVAKLSNMQFDPDGSSADYKKLSNMVFPSYGYDCDREEFNTNNVCTSLLGGMPVVAHAKRNLTKGHSFIIDAYKRQATETTYIYKWVAELPLDPTGGNGIVPITPTRPDSIVIAYSNIHLLQIKMNWGWGYSSENETWYTPTGDWIANNHNYDRDRHIIYNFRKKQL